MPSVMNALLDACAYGTGAKAADAALRGRDDRAAPPFALAGQYRRGTGRAGVRSAQNSGK